MKFKRFVSPSEQTRSLLLLMTPVRLVQLVDANDVNPEGSLDFTAPFDRPYDWTVSGHPRLRARTFAFFATGAGLREIKTYADGIGPWKRYIVSTAAAGLPGPGEASRRLLPPTDLIERAHKIGLVVHTCTFRNEQSPLASDYAGNPVNEYLQFYRSASMACSPIPRHRGDFAHPFRSGAQPGRRTLPHRGTRRSGAAPARVPRARRPNLRGRKLIRWMVIAAGGVAAASWLHSPPPSPASVAPTAPARPQEPAAARLSVFLPIRDAVGPYAQDPFSPRSWARPARPRAAAAAPGASAPTAPSVPYRVAGEVEHDGTRRVVLARDDRVLIVQQRETLDDGYRVEAVEADSVTLVYLPLGVRESIPFSSSR